MNNRQLVTKNFAATNLTVYFLFIYSFFLFLFFCCSAAAATDSLLT